MDEGGDGASNEEHWDWATDPVETERDADEPKPVQREVEEQLTDEQKKQRAVAACSVEHAELYACLKKGFFADCENVRKAFWNCYAEHRGVNENKVAAWFNSLKLFKGDTPQSYKEIRASKRADNSGAQAESK